MELITRTLSIVLNYTKLEIDKVLIINNVRRRVSAIKIFPKMKTISRYNLIRWEYKEGEMSSFEFKSGVKVSGIRRS